MISSRGSSQQNIDKAHKKNLTRFIKQYFWFKNIKSNIIFFLNKLFGVSPILSLLYIMLSFNPLGLFVYENTQRVKKKPHFPPVWSKMTDIEINRKYEQIWKLRESFGGTNYNQPQKKLHSDSNEQLSLSIPYFVRFFND